MQVRKVVDGLCEWEFKVKLKEAMEQGWEPIDKTMDIVPMANGAIWQYFIVVKKEWMDGTVGIDHCFRDGQMLKPSVNCRERPFMILS